MCPTCIKKIREFTHIEHFKEICPFFLDGEIECTEEPDFIVHSQDYILGIEHTEMFQPGSSNGTSLQAQDNLSQRVVNKANDLYFKHNSQPLLVQIFFNHRVMIVKKNVNHLAEAVVRLISMTPIEPGNLIIIKRTTENSECFPKEIVMLRIYAHPNGKENKWCSSSPGRIPEITPEYLQEKIDQKEQKLDNYKSKCSELWLLIVADDLRIPSTVDITESASTHKYTTRFNRVFFFWNSTRRYIELQLIYSDSNKIVAEQV
jgi:hypothetical protein